MKLPCAVTRDLLPLYAENMVEEETKALIEEHLDECADCRKKLSELEVSSDEPIDTIKPFRSLKKQILIRRLYAVAIAALCVFVGVYTYFFRIMAVQMIPWQDGLIEVIRVETIQFEEQNTEGRDVEYSETAAPSPTVIPASGSNTGEALVLNVNKIVNGFQEHYEMDEEGKQTLYIQALSTNCHSDNLSPSSYEVTIAPVPDRLIYGFQQPQTLLWGEPMEDGLEILPRLALTSYLIFATVAAGICGLIWGIRRKWKYSWILRQTFFAPVSYVLSHILLKGNNTTSFDMEHDVLSILLVALAIYALLSVAWQIFLQRRKEA